MAEQGTSLFKDRTIPIAALVVILLIVIAAICAMASSADLRHELRDVAQDFYGYPQEAMADYYNCRSCGTIVPCPLNSNRSGRPCPSCGLMMGFVSRGMGGAGNGNLGGIGQSGNLVCPDCGTLAPHRMGMPAHNVSCPKCGVNMYRQLPAGIPTAFFSNNTPGNQPYRQNYWGAPPPPINSNSVMTHAYRGVCSKCHNITDLQQQTAGTNSYMPVGGGGFYNQGQNNPFCATPGANYNPGGTYLY